MRQAAARCRPRLNWYADTEESRARCHRRRRPGCPRRLWRVARSLHQPPPPRAGPQATAQPAIERDLRRANIRPGQTVLEIGTGTGLTGALLAELVGGSGHVVSVDIDACLIRRAAGLHAERGVGNVTLVIGDGGKGGTDYGPYDVIIAWATPAVIPRSWLEQSLPGGTICSSSTSRRLPGPAPEPRVLAPDPAGHRQLWRDFRAYCAARDHGSDLTSHGTPDGDNAIGFSSGNDAAVLTDTGTILASTAGSPALAKLRDRLDDWENAGRPKLTDLTAIAENNEDGAVVRLALPSR